MFPSGIASFSPVPECLRSNPRFQLLQISVYPRAEEVAENPNSRRVRRREMFRARREKRRARENGSDLEDADEGFSAAPLISIASVPEAEASGPETVVC